MKPFPSRFRLLIAYISIGLVLVFSAYCLWELDLLLDTQNEWCRSQRLEFVPEICAGVAERDIERTYYLRMIVFALVTFGSAGTLLATSGRKWGER
ncbi:MAG: hypothetical protein QM785_17835 [Pyrinomonadaceae bacterium]